MAVEFGFRISDPSLMLRQAYNVPNGTIVVRFATASPSELVAALRGCRGTVEVVNFSTGQSFQLFADDVRYLLLERRGEPGACIAAYAMSMWGARNQQLEADRESVTEYYQKQEQPPDRSLPGRIAYVCQFGALLSR